ncbi:C-3 sterol dehydrogenase [Fomitiporia mediterranea MF3/22]|uniref:C-3 sterol dehydrogenase n=1 Tax=Fomitiporia mediterranea (strain MF3/22) TaxID=694068 RepID=UPI000440811E|nr:C-3 sterol dehydrogenase [Fomitiporia mediterranea MF3/22]EJC98847.1 C-3 sterol dehydrogenase [Fomitiporia mediterranea MF3/22]
MSATKENYIVIGGSGFLGRHIVEALLNRGDTVSVLDIVQRHHDVPFYNADISVQSQVEDAFRKSGTTCIIHTASPPHGLDPAIYWKVNVEGTKAVISAATALNIKKLVFTSSAGVVFNGQDIINVDERLPYPEPPFDAYNESKAKAEELVLEANGKSGLLTVALRPAGIYGPGDRQAMQGLMQVFYNRQTHFQIGDNNNLFEWTYVTNVAKAHLLAADRLSNPRPDLEEAVLRPLPTIDLSTGVRRVPTSTARPIGPAMQPPPNAEELEEAYRASPHYESRPITRSRFDQLSPATIERTESDPLRVDGQVFFITNGEPVYFWDFARAVWHEMGDPLDRSYIKLPRALAGVIATLAEGWGWVTGKEPTFTRFRVAFTCATRWHNMEKARLVLGYEPDVGVVEGVKRMCDWYKAEYMQEKK